MNRLKLVINNNFSRQKFFVKKELKLILNLYAKKVSSGDWKDYSLSVNKKEISFDIYQRASDMPVLRISKSLNPKEKIEKFYVADKNGRIIKKSENLVNLISKIEWGNLKLVK
tara:strand:- start:545 stop:883 length:339 start_codon:yes stop_codon:yes gene_type:complete